MTEYLFRHVDVHFPVTAKEQVSLDREQILEYITEKKLELNRVAELNPNGVETVGVNPPLPSTAWRSHVYCTDSKSFKVKGV